METRDLSGDFYSADGYRFGRRKNKRISRETQPSSGLKFITKKDCENGGGVANHGDCHGGMYDALMYY